MAFTHGVMCALDIEKWDEWVSTSAAGNVRCWASDALTHSLDSFIINTLQRCYQCKRRDIKKSEKCDSDSKPNQHFLLLERMQFISVYTKQWCNIFEAQKTHKYFLPAPNERNSLLQRCCVCVFRARGRHVRPHGRPNKKYFPLIISALTHTHTYWLICIIIFCAS